MGIFSKNAVGLDISDGSIEVISLNGDSGNVEILSKGRIKLLPGIVERGKIKDSKKLSEALKKVLKDAKPKAIKSKDFFVVLPETVCFTCVVDLKPESGLDLSDIAREAHNLIPLLPSESTISHKINTSEKENRALVIAAENDVLAEWHNFFDSLGFKVNGFDSEPLAVYRGLFSERKKSSVAIVDIGAFITNVSIFIDGFLRHSYWIDIAGENISQTLISTLSISHEEAEKIKKDKGLGEAGSKESQIITKNLDAISNSLEETLPYFENKFGKKFDEVVLVGGTSSMPGIEGYFEANLSLKTSVGSSFVFKKMGLDSILYIEAVGLAMRGLNDDWDKNDPLLRFDGDLIKKEVVVSKENASESKIKIIKKEPNKDHKNKKSSKKILILLIVLALSVAGLVLVVVLKGDKEKVYEKEKREIVETGAIETFSTSSTTIDIREPETGIINVIITNTPTGWLNVREGPGVENEQIARVYPGETYELIEESDDWYKIKIKIETEGWISSQYANKN